MPPKSAQLGESRTEAKWRASDVEQLGLPAENPAASARDLGFSGTLQQLQNVQQIKNDTIWVAMGNPLSGPKQPQKSSPVHLAYHYPRALPLPNASWPTWQ